MRKAKKRVRRVAKKTANFMHFRFVPSFRYDKRSVRSIKHKNGVVIRFACAKGKWAPRKKWAHKKTGKRITGKCSVGTRALEILIPRKAAARVLRLPKRAWGPVRRKVAANRRRKKLAAPGSNPCRRRRNPSALSRKILPRTWVHIQSAEDLKRSLLNSAKKLEKAGHPQIAAHWRKRIEGMPSIMGKEAINYVLLSAGLELDKEELSHGH